MIAFFWHPHFYLVQVDLFILASLSLFNNGKLTIYNNSTFYKSIEGFLVVSVIIISFIEHKWWFSILYVLASMVLQYIPASILKGIFAPEGRRGILPYYYAITINLASVLLLGYSIYVIIF
jgi:hypothetical protein